MKKQIFLKNIYKSIVLILVGTMLFSCENNLATIASINVDENSPIETSYDVEMQYTDSGIVTMVMLSSLVNRYVGENEHLEMPEGINLKFFDTVGVVKSTLVSDYAISYAKTNTMIAENNVIATNSRGQKLFTEQLTWNKEKHTIYTNKKVKVVTDGKILFGDGLTSDESFDNWEITNPTGDIEVDEGDDSSSDEEYYDDNESDDESDLFDESDTYQDGN
ncbi:MAG: LPS export ABC transporter periplasmic protein LptC [Bacteroidetes bacterium]|nr:MAG: LPS export ABC transporter periplasmic protein LptC [Bacteroidota bacterium]